MAAIEKQVAKWTSAALISEEQAEQIVHFEKEHHKPWVQYLTLALGLFIFAVGLVSFIAANWEEIPSVVKLGTNLFLIAFFAVAAYITYGDSKKILYFDFSLGLFSVFSFVAIPNLSQFYHTTGEVYQGFLFWCLLIAFAGLYTKRLHVSLTWLFTLLVCLPIWVVDKDLLPDSAFVMGLIFAFPLYYFGALQLLRGYVKEHPLYKSGVILGVLPFGGLLLVNEITLQLAKGMHPLKWLQEWPFYIALYLSLGLVAVSFIRSTQYSQKQKQILLAMGVVLLVPAHLAFIGAVHHSLAALFTIIFLALFALFTASVHQKGWFKIAYLCIGLRVVSYYIAATAGLMDTGLTLMVLGALIIGTIFAMKKYYPQMQHWSEGAAL